MPTILPDEIEYHALPIPDEEQNWLKNIYAAITDITVVPHEVELALELAWKRGYAKGAR